jgi:SAM-dependent methyltransferase
MRKNARRRRRVPGDAELLRGQQAYYDARAPEYDEWWERRGRYDHGPAENAAWFSERAEVEAYLAALPVGPEVLELACGTGNWTGLLLARARALTALDGSPQMLARHAARWPDPRITRRRTDLFDWRPAGTYDTVAFAFWLSHVPPGRLPAFLAAVRAALAPGGRCFFVDSRPDPATTTPDQPLPAGRREHRLRRRLNDGREFTIVKVFHDPEALAAAFAAAGLRAEVRTTARFFLYGSAVAADPEPPPHAGP